MNSNKSSQILDWVTQDKIPSNLNLTERVLMEAGQSPRKIPTLRMKLATSLVIAIGVLILLSTVAYAVYRLIIDPGMQSVRDAGLVTNLGATAQPTILPIESPAVPPSALMVDQSQTVEGVTMTLDWVYLDETRLLFGIHFSELTANVSVGFANVEVNGQPLGNQQQVSKFLQVTSTQGIYLSNQVTQSIIYGENVALSVDIPVLRIQDRTDIPAAVFNFKVDQVPLNLGRTLKFDQSAATNVNGVEMQLTSLSMTPAAIEAVVCPAPASSTIFSAQQAALSGNGLTEREFKSVQPIKDPVASCQKLTFDPQGFEGSSQLTLVVNEDWKFSIDLPAEAQIPGVKPAPSQPTPQPVAAQSIDQVNLTLDWTFVDAKRIAFGYTVTGFPEIPDASILGGTINVTDSLGFQYSYPYGGSSTIERDNNKSGTIHGTWSAILMEPLAAEEITLNIDITLDGSYGTDWNHMIGNINPTAGPFYPVKSDQWTVVPSGLIGTYHFETTSKVYPMTTLAPHEVVTANGIQMELLQAELTPSTSSFILCYNKPSAEDWMIGNTVLTSGIEQASINGYTLLSDANYVMKNPSILPPTSIGGQFVRCAEIDFQLGHSTQPRTIVLTVPALERSVPEVFPQVELDSALAKLKEQGIEMTYSITRGVGGGGGGPEYTKLPEGMTQLEAYDRFMDVIGYRAPGPWVFTFPYQP